MFLVLGPRSGVDGESVGEVVGGKVGASAQMGVEGEGGERGGVEGEATDEDVEEEDVGFMEGEEEGACMARGAEVEELLGELGDGGEVGVEAIEDELRVELGEVGEGGGLGDEGEERVAAEWCRQCAAQFPVNHLHARAATAQPLRCLMIHILR